MAQGDFPRSGALEAGNGEERLLVGRTPADQVESASAHAGGEFIEVDPRAITTVARYTSLPTVID